MEVTISGATLLSREEYLGNMDIISTKLLWFWLRDGSKKEFDLASAVYYRDILGFYEVESAFNVVPALYLKDSNLSLGTKITYAGESFTVLRNNTAICDRPVIKMAFREDYWSEDANNYDYSDVRGWLESWFGLNGNIAKTYI